MARSSAVRALAPLAMLAAAGCQDYNFNPVGHCLVQPGNERVTLSDLSSADILFVVDDSGSMAAEQAKLAANFSVFIDNLDRTNAERAAAGLSPIDFHIAVTTTSVFWNPQFGSSFSYTCQGGVCRNSSGVALTGEDGEQVTCSREGSVLPDQGTDETGVVAGCGYSEFPSGSGRIVGGPLHTYDFQLCNSQGSPQGVAVEGTPYPQGDFVSWNANPRVLHFDKELYPASRGCSSTVPCEPNEVCVDSVCRQSCATTACGAGFACRAGACQPTNRQGFTSDQLISWFSAPASGNVIVGTCGSGQEQALQAARLAVEKALDGRQKDTFNLAGQATWDPTTRVASAEAEWPRENSKLVLVFVGDEDDCSSPDDASGGIIMRADPTGADACVRDWESTDGTKKKQFPVSEFVDYFAGLGRPLGAAFIFPAEQTSCSGATCTAGLCCQTDCPAHPNVCAQGTDNCGAQAPGHRLVDAANQLRNRGADVITGSVCDPNFGALLDELAEIVKPPVGLQLATRPAEMDITVLRIADKNGQTRKTCNGPAPAGISFADAQNANVCRNAAGDPVRCDWWFTETADAGAPSEVSTFIYINHATNNCEANPGETYSADYIAVNPPGGCDPARLASDCVEKLGGSAGAWGCYTPQGPGTLGTCVCCTATSTDPGCNP